MPTLQTLAGCYTAVITPFTADNARNVDFTRFTEQIKFQAEGGVAGIVPCGTTGESPTLSASEWEQVVKHAITVGHENNLTVIVGTGSNNTAHAVELQKRAHALGADAGLSVNPYYNKPTPAGLYRHFMTVADAADLAVLLYNIPGRAGVTLTPETVARLAPHPNIIGVKEATGSIDSASEMLHRCKNENLCILAGDDTLTLPYAAVGASGVVSVISNILPHPVQQLCNAFLNNNWQLAKQYHYELLPLARGLLTLATNPIPLKTALKILHRDSGTLRLPLCEPDPETLKKIHHYLNQAKLSPHPPTPSS